MNPTLTVPNHVNPPIAVPAAPARPWHVLGMEDLAAEIPELIATARHFKAQAKNGTLPKLLEGVVVGIIFEKNSTRTRVSFEVGIQRLGGIVTILDAQNSQLGRGESIEDTAGCLSRYVDCIVYRAKDHVSASALAQHATVPVVNALTDREHPCQVLADLQALVERFEADGLGTLEGKTLAYVGDGNNMCHSYLLAAPLVGMNIQVACPEGYGPDPEIVARAEVLAAVNGTDVFVTSDPVQAVRGAHVVATDTWVSMGSEAEAEARAEAFRGFIVDDALLNEAEPGAYFMHCLPGHWGEEATYAVAHGPRSLIYDEAENRMWAQMALVAHILGRAA